MTVREFITQHKHENKSFCLIPNILINQKFNEPSHHFSHEVNSIGAVNEEIIDKKVLKTWLDSNGYVIIWEKTEFNGVKYIDNEE